MRCEPAFLPPSSPDVVARRRLSSLLRQFALRRCDGDQLMDWYQQVAQSSDDLTLQKLLDDNWLFIQEADEWIAKLTWADIRKLKLQALPFLPNDENPPPMQPKDRKAIARWVLYLRSELVYEWPTWQVSAQLCRCLCLLMACLSFGLIKFPGLRYEDYGDLDFYPFLNREEYETALRSPRLLCGKRTA